MDKTDNTAASRLEEVWICLLLPACVILASVFQVWFSPIGVVLLVYPVFLCAEDALLCGGYAIITAFAPILARWDTALHKEVQEVLSEASEDLCSGIPLAASLLFLASRIGWSNGWALFIGIAAVFDIAINVVLWICVLYSRKRQ